MNTSIDNVCYYIYILYGLFVIFFFFLLICFSYFWIQHKILDLRNINNSHNFIIMLNVWIYFVYAAIILNTSWLCVQVHVFTIYRTRTQIHPSHNTFIRLCNINWLIVTAYIHMCVRYHLKYVCKSRKTTPRHDFNYQQMY